MKRKYWILLGVVSMVSLVGVAGAGFAYFEYQARKVEQFKTDGLRAYESGDWQKAKSSLRRYLSKHNDDTETLVIYADATSHVLENRYLVLADLAQAYFQLVDRDPDDRATLGKLMETQVIRRDWSDLEYYTSFFLGLRPDDEMLQYHQALAWDRLDRVDVAISAYEKLIEKGTSYTEVYGNLARLLNGRGLEAKGREVLDEAVALRPEDAELYVQRAFYLDQLLDLPGAGEDVQVAMELAPEDGKVLTAAMIFAARNHEVDGVIGYGEQALAAGSDDARVYRWLIDAYREVGRVGDAIALCTEMDAYYRADHPDFFLILAELYLRDDDLDHAREVMSEYRRIHPHHNLAHNYLDARVLLAEGNAVSAATKLTTVTEAKPDFKQAHLYLVAARLQLQDRRAAKIELESYLFNNPNDRQAQNLYRKEFGGAEALGATLAEARAMMESDTVTPNVLLSSATSLYNKSALEEVKAEHLALMKSLTEKAIAMDPESPSGYGVLAEICANVDDIDGANRAMERAAEHGVDISNLRLVQAVIAAAKGEDAEALAFFEEELDSTEITVDDVVRWASFLTRRVSFAAAMQAIDMAMGRIPTEQRDALAAEQIDIATRMGEFDRALTLVEGFELSEDLSGDAQAMLGEKKRVLIGALVKQGTDESIDKAEALATSLREASGDSIAAQILHVEVLLSRTPPDVATAQSIVSDVLELDPFNHSGLVAAARIAGLEEDYVTALKFAEDAIAASGGNAEAYLVMAEMQIRVNRKRDAAESLEATLRLDPKNVNAMTLLVEVLRSTGRTAEAKTVITQLERAADDSERSRNTIELLRARVLLESSEDLASVEAIFRARLEEKPDDLRTVGDLARVMAAQGRRSEGGSFFKAFVNERKEDAAAWVALGRFYLELPNGGDVRSASTAMTQALIVDRDFLPAISSLIEINVRQNNSSSALKLCTRYLEQDPNSPSVLYQKARLLAAREDWDYALEVLNRSIDLQSQPQKLEARGGIYLSLKRYRDAITDYQEIDRVTGETSPRTHLALADAYAGLDDLESALRHFQQADARLHPNDPLRSALRFKRLDARLNVAEDAS